MQLSCSNKIMLMNDLDRTKIWADALQLLGTKVLKDLLRKTLDLYCTWLGKGRKGLKGLCFLNCDIVGPNLYCWLCKELEERGQVSLWLDDQAGISKPLDVHIHSVLVEQIMYTGQASPAVARLCLEKDFGL